MKRLLSIFSLLLLCVTGSEAGSIVTATITVTNTPSDGDTIIVNGSTRTWKNSVASSSTQIGIGASIGANATNLFNQFARTPFTTLTLGRSGTNGVTLRGIVDQTITISISGTWGQYSLSTNTTTQSDVVRTPATSYSVQSEATNIYSEVVTGIGSHSTNAWATRITALRNYADLTTSQTLSNKLMFGGSTTNMSIGASGAWITNAYIYGALNLSNTSPKLIINDTDGAADEKVTQISLIGGGFSITAWNDAFTLFDFLMTATRTGTDFTDLTIDVDLAVTGDMTVSSNFTATLITNSPIQGSTLTLNTYSGNIAKLTNGTITGSTITNGTYYGTIGLLSGGYLNGVGSTNLTQTNSTLKGVTYVPGGVNFERSNHTALANGANAAVNFGDAYAIKVKVGPTLAFSIAGIANGANGKAYRIFNTTGQNMTISHDSGGDPTPANRIYTTTGADIATTGDGIVDVWYDSEDSRWRAALISQ